MRFGMHLNYTTGPRRAKEIGCKSLQIFCGNPRGWLKKPLDPEFVRQFRNEVERAEISPVVVHASYLINLASPDQKVFSLSSDGLVSELERSALLGARFYVIHSGSHRLAGPVEGRRRVAACLQHALKKVPHAPEILIENTAGGASSLGTTFEELAALFDESKIERLGLCLDTCHLLAAGYDIRTPNGVKNTLDALDGSVGLQRLRCLHVNDSKGALGSNLDRHEHIGAGCIGTPGFKAFFSDPRLWNLPAILETPQDNPNDDVDNLWRALDIALQAGAVNAADIGQKPVLPVALIEPVCERSSAELAGVKIKPVRKAKKKPAKKSPPASASAAKPARRSIAPVSSGRSAARAKARPKQRKK